MRPVVETVKLTLDALKDSLMAYQIKLKNATWLKHSIQRDLRSVLREEALYRRLIKTTEAKIRWEATKHSKELGLPTDPRAHEGEEWRAE